ncbi:MAG: MotR [Methylophilaceae bacterium]|nr:MotR [Methylophilaceae bacterium]
MVNTPRDQAAGLRRIMAGPQPRVVSILSATNSGDKSRTLSNLAVSLRRNGSDVLVVNAATNAHEVLKQYGINGLPSLMAVAQKKRVMEEAILLSPQGFYVANLMANHQLTTGLDAAASHALNKIFESLAHHYDVVLVDAELTAADTLPLQIMNDSEIIIELTNKAESIKQAYRLIKQVYSQLGKRSFGILVTNVNDTQAQDVFRNLAQVARRYLSIELEFMGAIPPDEHLNRATQLGRSVVEAFPMALATAAFKALAKRLGYALGTRNQNAQRAEA